MRIIIVKEKDRRKNCFESKQGWKFGNIASWVNKRETLVIKVRQIFYLNKHTNDDSFIKAVKKGHQRSRNISVAHWQFIIIEKYVLNIYFFLGSHHIIW